MIINHLSRRSKFIAWSFYFLFYGEWLMAAQSGRNSFRQPVSAASLYSMVTRQKAVNQPEAMLPNMLRSNPEPDGKPKPANLPLLSHRAVRAEKKADGGGPTQPEMQAFQSVNANNMVDLFSGDFSYNIPLMDVGGYPVNISYRSGISMDQEASWVGLGWNVNPGTVTRNLRGVPDDFNGNDSIKKTTSIKENKTVGVTTGGGGDIELTGFPISIGLGASVGIFHNTYKGWGLENGVNASLNAGGGASGGLTGGLGLALNNNSQDGVTITPSLSVQLSQQDADAGSGASGSFSTSLPYNSRTGLKGLQMSFGIRQSQDDNSNQHSASLPCEISFASMAYTPTITMPITSTQFTFTTKVGLEEYVFHPSFFISGYGSSTKIDKADTSLSLPAYGYLHYQDGANNKSALLDMNREKEMIYRDNPPMPHIAVPLYTYDAFSITGEGTGGMFRAYRGDIGFVYDHFIRTKDASQTASVDVGVTNLAHVGVDLNMTRSFTQNGAWVNQNNLQNAIHFKQDSGLFEAAYFRNPSEKSINSKNFYDAIGGDDVVTGKLFQPGTGSSLIQATSYLTRYRGARAIADKLMTPQNSFKQERDKRTQVISYLNATEADAAGLSKYIENYAPNQFSLANCISGLTEADGLNGVIGEYYPNTKLGGVVPYTRIDNTINFNWNTDGARVPVSPPYDHFPGENFSIRWTGRIKAPVTGTYTFTTVRDDGVRLWLNDTLLIDKYITGNTEDNVDVNLIAGHFYKLRMEYVQYKSHASIQFEWAYPGQAKQVIPASFFYLPPKDVIQVNSTLTLEKRVTSYRKPNHLSQIDVLNADGRKYVYGIPVYNFKQKETTFAVDGKNGGNSQTGLVKYTHDVANADNTAGGNQEGKDWYYNSEEIPAYAHSFLLTGILSPDYVDLTGNGISDDDLGDAVKFNYSKICDIAHPYRWRAPYVADSATYNEGLKTESRDDKGNYVYGEKELWFLHSIQSKTMIATFVTENRADLFAVDEAGHKVADSSAKRLKEINLYSKADFVKNGTGAIPVKTVHFEYSYELCRGANKAVDVLNRSDSGKLTLKKIWFTYNGNNKGKQNPYIFNYNSLNPAYNIKSYDRWGNYKDPSQNPTSGSLLTNAEYPYALQDSTLAAHNAAAWALDSIYLPSGGAIKVAFESDDYAYVQNRRSMDLFKLAGLGPDSLLSHSSNKLYDKTSDNLYVFVQVPQSVSSKADLLQKYLAGVTKLYFKLFVRMPDDQYGTGSEYVSCYADLATGNSYGIVNSTTIWIRLSGISLAGDADGSYSPLAKAAIQYLRLNLPSKAFSGSEPGDNLDIAAAVKMVFIMGDNLKNTFKSFDATARAHTSPWCTDVDLNRTFIRLDDPYYKKYGGGHRVKKITIYDKWDKMVTGQRPAVYGQEYTYTTQQEINGVTTTVSSGVASYEPGIGGEENPFRQPIEYVEKIAPLGPVTLGYSEEPLGESIFPSAGIGYSKVRVRTINYKNKKSANGYEETTFYTAYDFPTFTDRSLLDNDTKKRYKPGLANFLRINAYHYLTLSQGFKVELNDMHGKLRSQAYYPETDPSHYTSYTENIYRVENPLADAKKLSNVVSVMHPDGTIDTAAYIGKDVELMMDMREQLSITNGNNYQINADMFLVSMIPPLMIIPSLIKLPQREENQFRSVAALKVIQRYAILDSVIHIDKGSKVSTRDLLYDSETGEVLLTRTQNEFNDPVYSFSYPSHWAYDGMGLAYKNIDLILQHVGIKSGKLITGSLAADSLLFSSGDEILVAGKQQTGATVSCVTPFSKFPDYTKIWSIDSSILHGGPKSIYFIDKDGLPYNGNDITLKIIRSGRRNMNSMVGSVTTLQNPLVWNPTTQQYSLSLSGATGVLNAASSEFKQFWKVEDHKVHRTTVNCVDTLPADCSGGGVSCSCVCLKKLFDYLLSSHRLFIKATDNITVASLVASANSAGYSMSATDCPVLQANQYKLFAALTSDSLTNFYAAKIGDFLVELNLSTTANIYHFYSTSCGTDRVVNFNDTVDVQPVAVDTISKTLYVTKSLTHYYLVDSPVNVGIASHLPYDTLDINTTKLVAASEQQQGSKNSSAYYNTDIFSLFKFDSISSIPSNAVVQSANLYLTAYPTGFAPPTYPSSHTISPLSESAFKISVPSGYWDYSSYGVSPGTVGSTYAITATNQNLTVDVAPMVNQWLQYGNYGLYLSAYYYTLRYNTFCSQRYSDATKRPHLDIKYTVPATQSDSITGTLSLFYRQTCDTITDYSCRSVVTDSTFNPYTSGVLGNWRGDRNYTYFGTRAETDPSTGTNIRHNGVFHDFAPFWNFQPGKLTAQYDTTRWVWNSELTMFNRKGLEIENKDPLGRYNSILYGYNLTLPVAVTQNGHYRETAFEGFEDYGFLTQTCDTACPSDRHIDFTPYLAKLTTAQRHSGKSSLQLNTGDQAGLQFSLTDQDTAQASLTFATSLDGCTSKTVLNKINIPNTILLPTFSPYKGKQMVVSAWVKEQQSCTCTSYVYNDIKVVFTVGGSTQTLTFQPSGNIIEGWQRYEGVFTIPANATDMSVNMEATGSTTVYFDDLRIHPFNANMKSFVYNPTNLRLMAEQDENNYSTFYEYDDDGTLIRVKKETERGIQTIKETRSAILKQ